jgi:hypothetical protein
MNKKSQLFSILLVILFVIVMTTALIVIGRASGNKEKIIGHKPGNLFHTYLVGERELFRLDSAARTSAGLALLDFEANGHYTDFGKKENYAYWRKGDKRYIPDEDELNKKFVPLFINELKPYFNYTEADVFLDIEKGQIIGRKMWAEELKRIESVGFQINSSAIHYHVKYDFAEKISDFDYSPVLLFISDTDQECRDKEWHNVIDDENQLKECVEQRTSEKIRTYNLCETGKEFFLYRFAEEYNYCADSLDYDCQCELTAVENIQLETENGKTKASFGDYQLMLNKPYKGQLQKIILKTETGLEAADMEYPKCRISKRTYKFCYEQDNAVLNYDLFEPVVTKFAIEVEDRAAPPAVEAVVEGNNVRWKASPAPDVLRYRIYAAPKGAPFIEDEFIAIERTDDNYRGMFKNHEQAFTYISPRNLDDFNVKVVAEDLSGNFILAS